MFMNKVNEQKNFYIFKLLTILLLEIYSATICKGIQVNTLFITDIPAPYRIEMYNTLAKYLDGFGGMVLSKAVG